MLTNICLLHYNNYYNRELKHPYFFTDEDGYSYNLYSQYVDETSQAFSNINFYKNDGVTTTLTVNLNSSFDYLVEYEPGVVDSKVLSRWFIIECQHVRNGQTVLTLKRDTLVDYYDYILDAPAFIEKATVPVSDVAIYNQEPYQYNEIKQSQTPIKDRTNNAWIVGYFLNRKEATTSTTSGETTITTKGYTDEADITLSGLKIPSRNYQMEVANISDLTQYTRSNPRLVARDFNPTIYTRLYSNNLSYRAAISYTKESTTTSYSAQYLGKTPLNNFHDLTRHYRSKRDIINSKLRSVLGAVNFDTALAYDRKYIKDVATNKLYYCQVHYKTQPTSAVLESSDIPDTDKLYIYQQSILNYEHTSNQGSVMYIASYYSYATIYYSVIEVNTITEQVDTILPATARYLDRAPYKMFVLPLNSQTYIINGSSITYNTYPEASIALASAMATQMGSQCYDVQLLPYFPMPTMVTADGAIDMTNELASSDYAYVRDHTDSSIIKYIINFGKQSDFTFTIDFTIDTPNNPIEAKIARQCHKYRLASPNSAAFCDFNEIATGSITKLNVDCTYKPYSPYIHINPDWHGLYGNDYNTPRGLVCQGDFSLPVLNDNWVNYQLNNKNYLNSFNREVDSIELNNKWSLANDIVNAVSGTVSGAAYGAMISGLKGAAIGGVVSAAGGVASVVGNDQLRKDALDNTKKQFNYSMQNIQAQPRTLAKNSAFDANNQIWAYIEFYDATPQEHNILRNNLKYDGFTINRIGTINEFICYRFVDSDLQKRFYKGAFIQIPDLKDDFHLANDLANEFHKGFYYTQEV